jgi:ferrous iron transport protein A
LNLSQLKQGTTAYIKSVQSKSADDTIGQRLVELGFVQGERVVCLSLAPFGGDPILVQIGFTRFALRKNEAARVLIEDVT